MPTLTITKTYMSSTLLTQGELDAAYDSISSFLNSTKLDSTNVQTEGLLAGSFANGTITINQMGTASVGASQIASSAATTEKFAPLSVTRTQQTASGIQLSSLSSTAQTVASQSGGNLIYVNVPALSTTITTQGRPVFLGLIASGQAGEQAFFGSYSAQESNQFAAIAYTRDGIRVGEYAPFFAWGSFNILQYGTFFPYHLDRPSAGTYTYGVQIIGGTIRQCKLVVFEIA